MKKIIFVFIILVVAISACHKKALPTITSRERESLPPATALTDIKPDLERGKIIFTNRCGRCHALPEPAQFTITRWEGILKLMIPRARLNNEQGVHVSAYVKANANL
jgi:hypothetical protein